MNIPILFTIGCLSLCAIIAYATAPRSTHDWGVFRTVFVIIPPTLAVVALLITSIAPVGVQTVVTKPATATRMKGVIVIHSPNFYTLVERDVAFLNAEVAIDQVTTRNVFGMKFPPYYRAVVVSTK